jgi:hypothetical protein
MVYRAHVSGSRLTILAGPGALAELRDTGLRAERVRVLCGASGGPKWLALHGIDRALFPWLLRGGRAPLHAVASSIGSYRFACLCARDPLSALERFAEAYVEQRYAKNPSPLDVSREGERIVRVLLGADGVAPLVDHPLVRLHIVTTRFRHLGALENRAQLLGLGFAALSNAISRRALSLSVERVVFDAGGDPGPFAPWRDLPTRHVPLVEQNALAALAASSAIPGVMAGVRDPLLAPPGVYRDGGIADYHFGSEIDVADGLTLYPHFYPELVPGWFDKSLGFRRTRGLQRVIVIAPSTAYVASLPYARIPDRADFARMRDSDRIAAWRRVLELGLALGEELMELVESGRIGKIAEAMP